MSNETVFDLFIIGGGINGAAVANQASAMGLSVALCDALDFGQGTSGASTKLIHGGIRYLEQLEFSLVRESLREQQSLRKRAAHLVQPLKIYMPDAHRLRKPWRVGLGLFLYDRLTSRQHIPRSKRITFSSDSQENPLNLSFKKGFSFYDCITQDTRLVMENLLAAHANNALMLPRNRCTMAQRENNLWKIQCQSTTSGDTETYHAKMLVNATGPWASSFLRDTLSMHSSYKIRLVKGSHLVFPKLYEGNEAYLLQNIDGRVIFVLPFMNHFTAVGTTEVPYEGDPVNSVIEPDEIYYLCDAVNRYFHHRVRPRDIIGSWSGVRPLIDNDKMAMTDLTRSARLELRVENKQLPIVNVWGGKLTTHRALAEKVLECLDPYLPSTAHPVKGSVILPGGTFPDGDFEQFRQELQSSYPWLPESLLNRYSATYGQRCLPLLDGKTALEDLGSHAGHGLYHEEAKFLLQNEWARNIEDILTRRTQLGYYFTKAELEKAEQWWDEQIF